MACSSSKIELLLRFVGVSWLGAALLPQLLPNPNCEPPLPRPGAVQLTEVGQAVESGVQHAVEYVKGHMPPVENAEPTAQERATQALLDEGMNKIGRAHV